MRRQSGLSYRHSRSTDSSSALTLCRGGRSRWRPGLGLMTIRWNSQAIRVIRVKSKIALVRSLSPLDFRIEPRAYPNHFRRFDHALAGVRTLVLKEILL